MRMTRASLTLVLSVVACGGSQAPPTAATPAPPPAAAIAAPTVAATAAAQPPEHVAADTPKTTTEGNRFTVPTDWTVTVKGPATILTPPEDGNWIALVDVHAPDGQQAVDLAWKAYKPDAKHEVEITTVAPDREGWSKSQSIGYRVSPNEKRALVAVVRTSGGDSWSVAIIDMQHAVQEKRGSQLGTIFGRFQPKGYERESFADKTAHPLDAERLAALGKYIEDSQKLLDVPGVGLGIVQDGKVVFAGGYGVKELGKPDKIDGQTLFMIASNTKALTTLLLARLVDKKKLDWETPATELLPTFKLGSPETTSKVLVKHLICACTGMPRQDLEWIFEYKGQTPETTLRTLGTMEPTSKFGELFQYSNLMAAAAGFIGGHVDFPKLALGPAYDRAMQTEVFEPLGMTSTTFDYAKALRASHAGAYAMNVDGGTEKAAIEINYAILPARPAGAAWSNVNDMLKYVQMELDEGTVGGKAYVSKDALLMRRKPQVAIGKDATYGMGLMVDKRWGVEVVHHGGDLVGYHSDMIWIPSAKVGAVILTNADTGSVIRSVFLRKLLEVLYDGKPEADENIATAAKNLKTALTTERKLIQIPADPAEAGKLAKLYENASLGRIAVSKKAGATIFDVGEWRSEVATKKNPDGTVTFETLRPGIEGFEITAGEKDGKRTLTIRDGQHEYVFAEKP